jgi:hypothetical protein
MKTFLIVASFLEMRVSKETYQFVCIQSKWPTSQENDILVLLVFIIPIKLALAVVVGKNRCPLRRPIPAPSLILGGFQAMAMP